MNAFVKHTQKKPFLLLLIFILAAICIVTFKPQFSFLGWDNYSSYFNLKTNIFRTLFATWRGYRGMGVPSDAEVTDLPRQLFFLVLSPFIHENSLDQLYYLFAFCVGILGMYVLSSYIWRLLNHEERFHKYQDAFAFITSFFYLFNLNTLAVFYFPMVMFVTRFYTLPFLFYFFLRILHGTHLGWRRVTLFLILFFLSTGSYMVPTVFITTGVSLGIFTLVQQRLKKAIFIFAVFLLLNAFWIGPFINYTLNKSQVVPLTSTFIDANEGFTNKSKDYYDAKKQMIFFPQFFDMKFVNTQISRQMFFHPLANIFAQYPNNLLVLYLFPILYCIGAVLLMIKTRFRREWLWIPLNLIIFLFLSLKEYSILGFVYSFLTKYIPLFGIVFRFADTKFHPYLAFTGSILAAMACIYLFDFMSKRVNRRYLIGVFFGLVIVPTVFLFQEYFKGNLIGFFMYNKIPQAYKQLTSLVNNDPEDVRVMHLPMDRSNYYWKPYYWGLYSSSFLNFMLDKPIFDKTFEPASLENAAIDKMTNSLQENIQAVEDEDSLTARAFQLYEMAKKVSVKYIVFDETVSTRLNARGIDVWGSFSIKSTKKLLQQAEKNGFIALVSEYKVSLDEMTDIYKGEYPYKKTYTDDLDGAKSLPITLYKVVDVDPKIQFLTSATKTALSVPASVPFAGLNDEEHTLQIEKREGKVVFPFEEKNNTISSSPDNIHVAVPGERLFIPGTYKIIMDDPKAHQTYLVDTYARLSGDRVVIRLFHRYAPTIEGKDFIDPLGEFVFDVKNNRDIDMRVRIDGVVLGSVKRLTSTNTYMGSTMVHRSPFAVELLQRTKQTPIDMRSFKAIPNDECYKDAMKDFIFSMQTASSSLDIASKNGSVCVWSDLSSYLDAKSTYAELHFTTLGSLQSLDKEYGYLDRSSTKPILKSVIDELPKPMHLKVCLKEAQVDDCYNEDDVQIGEERTESIGTIRPIDNMYKPLLFLGLRRIGYEEVNSQIKEMYIDTYESVQTRKVSIPKIIKQSEVDIGEGSHVDISFPTPQSPHASYYETGKRSLWYYNTTCSYYQTFRLKGDSIVSYTEHCDNTFLRQLPFSSDNFYLWQIDYNLASGQYPSFIMQDEYLQYVNERISLHQGYPNIPEFKKLSEPEFLTSADEIRKAFQDTVFKQAYTYIYPRFDYEDKKDKSFFIKQFTENEGLFTVGNMNIVEMPNSWATLRLQPFDSKTIYDMPGEFAYKQIIPSLWKIAFVGQEESDKKILLKFNEGYDSQWGVYDGLVNVLFGKSMTKSIRCDGFANCFEINNKLNSSNLYIFYWPERLSAIGWGITFATIVFFTLRLRKKWATPAAK